MDKFPHHYSVSAAAAESGMQLSSSGLSDLKADKPAEFDGPGDEWSPETLFVASVAACMILSFKAVAEASHFEYIDIRCETTGELDRVEKVTRFTRFTHNVTLEIESDDDREKAERLIEKADSICLISNSLNADVELNVSVVLPR